MKIFHFPMAVLALWLLGAAEPALAQTSADRLVAQAPTIDTRVDGELAVGAWRLAREANPDIYGVEVGPGERREVCMISGPGSLCRIVGPGEQYDFIVAFEGFDYPTRIAARAPAAIFDAAYQAENRGRTQILIPEVYELVNIAIALTPKGRNDRNLVVKDTPYYEELIAHFGAHSNHALIVALEAEMTSDVFKYFQLKMNGYAFEFDGTGRIVQSPVYARTGFRGDMNNHLAPYLELLQSFADDTGFRAFYSAHQPFYDSQISYYRDEIDVAGALAWLQTNFPAVKPYDSNKIIFSPLVGGNQSLTTFSNNGFTELQPHVNFPYPNPGDADLTPKDVALRRGAILFTEMNHGYINPTADTYAASVNEIFANRALWTTSGRSSDNYSSPMALFNEYMNWALVSLYFYDKADVADRDLMIQRLETLMRGRGFAQFTPFNQFLVELYAGRAAGVTLADLYPQIVAWAAQHQAASSPTT